MDTTSRLEEITHRLASLTTQREVQVKNYNATKQALDSAPASQRRPYVEEVRHIERKLAELNAEIKTLNQERYRLRGEEAFEQAKAIPSPVAEDDERKLAVQFACAALTAMVPVLFNSDSVGNYDWNQRLTDQNNALIASRAWQLSDAMMEEHLKRFAAEQPTADNPAAR